jgi:hypothetical protein
MGGCSQASGANVCHCRAGWHFAPPRRGGRAVARCGVENPKTLCCRFLKFSFPSQIPSRHG